MYSTHSGSVPDFVVIIHTTKLSSTEFTFSTLVLLLALWLFAILQCNPRAQLWVWWRCDVAQSSSGPYRKFNIEAPPASTCSHLPSPEPTCISLHFLGFALGYLASYFYCLLSAFFSRQVLSSPISAKISTTCSHPSSSRMHCLS